MISEKSQNKNRPTHNEITCGLSIKRNKFQWTKWVKIFTCAYGQGRGFVLRLPLYNTVEIYSMNISVNSVFLDTLKFQVKYCRTKKVEFTSRYDWSNPDQESRSSCSQSLLCRMWLSWSLSGTSPFRNKRILEVFHQVGVAEAFRQHSQIVEVSKAGGSSAGALVAAAMLTGLPMQSVLAQVVALRGSS